MSVYCGSFLAHLVSITSIINFCYHHIVPSSILIILSWKAHYFVSKSHFNVNLFINSVIFFQFLPPVFCNVRFSLCLFFSNSRFDLPPCSSQMFSCGKVYLGSSGSESIGVPGRSRLRWKEICWSTWSVRLRTNTGPAGRTWLPSRNTATQWSAEPKTGLRSKRESVKIFLSTSTWQITWVIWGSPKTGRINTKKQRLSFKSGFVVKQDMVYNLKRLFKLFWPHKMLLFYGSV